MAADLTLVSHTLCPFVQRAAIALGEKGVSYARIYVDLANKPAWFRAVSPLGKTPVLTVGETAIFESAVILEYLEETETPPLHPANPLERARHRAWIEFGSAILNDIAGFYSALDKAEFERKRAELAAKFARIEAELGVGRWFAGRRFSLVDAVFGPVFRYFYTFERIDDFRNFDGLPKVVEWRRALAARPSVRRAVRHDYPEELWRFLLARRSYLSALMDAEKAPPRRIVA